MCFIIRESHPKPYIAECDIEAYKVMYVHENNKDIVISQYQNYRYVLGKLYRAKFGIENRLYYIGILIYQGFHSFTHRYIANEHQEEMNSLKIITCIIPKGAKYYYDPIKEEYCSNQIIIIGDTANPGK